MGSTVKRTVEDSPAASSTRANPASWRFGRATRATSSRTYSCTTSVPARAPVFVTRSRMSNPSSVPAASSTRRSRVGERRVREPEAERIQGRGGCVDIVAVDHAATAAGAGVVVQRHLTGGTRQRDREAARRRRDAVQDVGDRRAALLARQPCVEQCRLHARRSIRGHAARPLITTTTVGVPVSETTASTSCCCAPGSARSVTSRNSPLVQFGIRPDRPPTTHTAMSASRALAAASEMPDVSALRKPAPLAYGDRTCERPDAGEGCHGFRIVRTGREASGASTSLPASSRGCTISVCAG